MEIPAQAKAQLAALREARQELGDVSNDQLLGMIQSAMQAQTAQADLPDEAEIGKMSAADLATRAEGLLNVGQWDEAEKVLGLAVERAEAENDLKEQLGAETALARLCSRRGDFPQAMALYQRALALAERLGDQWLQGVIYNDIGEVHRMQGRYPQAIEHYKKCLKVFEGREDIEDVAAAIYGNLGNVYLSQGDFDRAIEAHEQANTLHLNLGLEADTAKDCGNLGLVCAEQGRYDRAVEMFRKSLEITERLGDGACRFSHLGIFAFQRGNVNSARAGRNRGAGGFSC